ncbi:N-acetylneuraminate synthase [Prochlorococcus marinus XMU1411]|nr:N-acetylneuraminate synthase [Prochlorococcus marinus XMU1411]MBW3055300.1 N-acetylneuraminate synthase [Prochlorococcus marinus str. MU1411]
MIAEIGSVHDGSFGNACNLIKLAKECGANIVKFQTHLAEYETIKNAPMPNYFKGEPRYEYFERTSFSKNNWEKLKKYCDENQIEFLSSPFSIQAAELLNDLGIKKFKVPSGEVTNTPLLEKLAAIGKPVILSSGMSNWEELNFAIELLLNNTELCVMQCSSKYPCQYKDVGLNVLNELKKRYGNSISIGFSDHTTDISAGIAAAALGAKVIEKHLTFSKKMYGSDAKNALEPKDFIKYCEGIKQTWTMLENPIDKDNIQEYMEMKKIFQKSIFTSRSIDSGIPLQFDDLSFKKPGDGIAASKYKEIIGKVTKKNLPANHKLNWENFK